MFKAFKAGMYSVMVLVGVKGLFRIVSSTISDTVNIVVRVEKIEEQISQEKQGL